MNNQELSRQHAKISALFKITSAMTENNIEAQGHWARYLCILSTGFLEISLRELYSSYCKRCSNKNVARFTREALNRFQNPKTDKFLDVAKSFDTKWHRELEEFIGDNGRKEAINSLMGNRHKIAHGQNSDISLVRVREYFEKSVEVVEFIEQQCGL